MERPLAGVRVLDLSSSYAGPTCTTYLADMGASVLKAERPGTGDDTRSWGPPFRDGESAWFHSANRSKASLGIDLRSDAGQQLLDEILAVADVVVASTNPAKLSRLGLDPEAVRARHPHIVLCTLSGYGLEGPSADRPGYDLTAQARSGLMSVTGSEGGPPQRVSTALCDVIAGTIAAFAIAASLVRQRATGTGELVDVSLLDAGLSAMAPRIASYLAGEPEPVPSGATDSVLAVYQAFVASDRSIVVAVGNDDMWRRFCDALGAPELATDPRTATNADRRLLRAELLPAIADRIAAMPASYWLDRLGGAGVPAAPVQHLAEVAADEQVKARGSIAALSNGFEVVAPPWRLGSERGNTPPMPAVGPIGSGGVELLDAWRATPRDTR